MLISIATAIGTLSLDMRTAAAPSPVAPDSLLEQQWHLKSRSQEVGGANVRAAWPSSLGAGVVIGIVDDGLQYSHPDLSPNYLASASWDFISNDADPQPTTGHGTAVAGVAAARGDNTIGVSGAAPLASLAGLRFPGATATDAQDAAAFNFQPSVIHILNNSWNPSDNGTTIKGPGPQGVAARLSAVTAGRQGKGRIFVWSSGNGRLSNDDCNYDGYANSRFAIAVGASTDAAVQMPNSEGCSALMIVAPAGGGSRALTTTDLLATPGYDSGDYTSAFGTSTTGGMSAAAPTVSGAVALMLARNPNLTWRDVQHILRRTSVRILPTDAGWTVGAFPHNERFGFGLLDAEAAVNMAGTWANVPAEEVLAPATKNVNQAIPDTNATGISDAITISSNESNFVIEHVEVDVNITHPWRGDLQVRLTSPSGVVSNLGPQRPSDSGDNLANWKFGSARHWGQTAAGAWTLTVADRRFQDVGTWNNWTLRIYGYRTTASAPGAFGKSSPASGATGVPTSTTLTWTASSGATSYEYCYDTTNDSACANWIGAGANTSAAVSGLSGGLTYYWHVRATNATGVTYAQGSPTAFWGFTTGAAPGSFGKSSPANGATGVPASTSFTWTASSGATSYEYCYDTSNDNACASWISAGANTSAAVSGLSAGATYYWHVRATNITGVTYAQGSATAFWSFTTAAAPGPGAFALISPANGATAQPLNPTLDWSASSGATSYEYCYDTSNNSACNATWVSTGGTSSVALSGLTAGTTYYWHVRALNAAGAMTYAGGSPTAFWAFTTATAPGAFSHSAPANGATGQPNNPTLSWSASAGAASFEYCIDTTNDNACSGWISTGTNTSVGLSNLPAGTAHYWQVRAINTGGTTYANGAATTFWSFTTQGAMPGAFSKLSPADDSTDLPASVTLAWSPSAGAASYEYCYDTTNNNNCNGWTSVGSATSVVLSGLSDDTTYSWHVRAVNAAGNTYADASGQAFWSFTTLALPAAFSHGSPSNGALGQSTSPTLSWTASTGAASYEYCYDTTNDSACNTSWIFVASATSVALSGLAADTSYYWQVRAINTAGATYANGSATAFWTFTTKKAKAQPIVDLNGDGRGDVFTYNPATGAWARQVTLAGGGFSTSFGAWDPGKTVVPARFNDDGLTDFFVSDVASGAWVKMLNTGTGFSVQSTGTWWPGWQKFVMNLNGDGISDLFLYDPVSGQWHRNISTPTGFTFTTGTWDAGCEITPVNLNGDAYGDLFRINRTTGQWSWVVSEANGSFTYPQGGSWQPDWAIYYGDFSGDGHTDLFMHRVEASEHFVSLFTGDITSYSNGADWMAGWTPMVMDLNADGRADLFLYRQATGQWLELEGNGAGQFTTVGQGTWTPGFEIHATDFNDDGRADLLLYKPGTGEWYQAWNHTSGNFTYFAGTWQTGLAVVASWRHPLGQVGEQSQSLQISADPQPGAESATTAHPEPKAMTVGTGGITLGRRLR